jgi:membrane-associated phospholipid phosphatase
MLKTLLRRLFAVLGRFREQAGLSVSAMVAIAAGMVALGGTIGLLGGVTEDVTRHNGLSSTDPARLRWFIDHRPQALVSVARVLSELASPLLLVLVAVVAAGVLWYRGQRLLLAVAPGIAFGLAGLAAGVGKLIVGRNRPPMSLHLVPESDPSFPSGHATESMALFMTLALLVAVFVLRKPIARAAVVLTAGLLSFAVGAGRLVLGVHWPSDVIAGWALGATIALTVTLLASLGARIVPNRPTPSRPIVARIVRLVTSERKRQPLEAA